MMKKTRIVCTIGPASENEATLEKMINAGMNVARLNFSHGDFAEHSARIKMIRSISDKLNQPIALLLDTKGPEIRCGNFKDKEHILETGATFTFFVEDKDGDINGCSISYKDLYKCIKPGNRILVNDGLIGMLVKEVKGTDIICTVENGGKISNKKSANVPGISVPIPFLAPKDQADIEFAAEQGLDFIAASFTRTAEDIKVIKNILKAKNASGVKIIAKIENHEGIENFDAILAESDGIMVARGDLGVEIPFEQVPIEQRKMIERTVPTGKIVITATQMLESMTSNPRATRAEISDVSNAVWQGTTATMLSGESAAGKYPVEAVKTMSTVAQYTEDYLDYDARFRALPTPANNSPVFNIAHAACSVASSIKAKAIFVLTKSGSTVNAISSFRPACPIIAQSVSDQVTRQLQLTWGVQAFTGKECSVFTETLSTALDNAVAKGLLKKGDLIVIALSYPMGQATNFVKTHVVGESPLND